ncbi:MAG: hypothetical protein H8E72_07735 [Candidatus Marinimicrobia bacterium]|nr:hypothetical protein [Candidatus Neomarinimicrobiota bacterium]
MNKLYIILFLLSSMISAKQINTVWGPCNIEIYGGSIDGIDSIQEKILSDTQTMVNEWGAVTVRPFSLYITYSEKDFYAKAKGPVPEWGIAVAKRNPDRIIIQAPHVSGISFSRLLEVVSHELNHIYLNRVKQSYSIPSWYKEGMAMRQADEFSMRHRLEISKAKWKNQLFYFNDLEGFNRVRKSNATLAYAQSAAMVYAMEYFYGDDIHSSLISAMQSGISFWNAMEKITGDSRIDVQIYMEIFIEDNYNWMFLANASKSIFVILPFILIGGFLYKRRRSKRIMDAWETEELLEQVDWEQGDHNV